MAEIIERGYFARLKDHARAWWKPEQELSTEVLHFWAIIIGTTGGTIGYVYKSAIRWLVFLLWQWMPEKTQHLFPHWLPFWSLNWIIPTFIAALVALMIKYSPYKPGSMKILLETLHEEGRISSEHFFPMLIISTISISSGTSTGPEMTVMILLASFGGFIGDLSRVSLIQKRIITQCWMASGVAGFFEMSLGGALLVLEFPHRMGMQYYEGITPVIVSSLFSAFISKAISGASASGPFKWPTVVNLTAVDMAVGVLLGIVAAGICFAFVFCAKVFARVAKWIDVEKNRIPVMIFGGLAFGWIAVLYPQTLFWSEFEMNNLIDRGGKLPHTIVPGALHVAEPYSTLHVLGIAVAKIMSILICFNCGILFPMYFVGLAFGTVITDLVPFVKPTVGMMCMAAAVQIGVIRTPWATTVILLVSAAEIIQAPTQLIAVFPIMLMCSYTTLFLTRKYHYYPHSMQRSRTDLIPLETLDPESQSLLYTTPIDPEKELTNLSWTEEGNIQGNVS